MKYIADTNFTSMSPTVVTHWEKAQALPWRGTAGGLRKLMPCVGDGDQEAGWV